MKKKKMQTCRICLAVQMKMYKIDNEAIKSFIENIFKAEGFSLSLDVSNYVCFECKGLLHKSYNFIQKALRAQKAMYKIIMKDKRVSLAALQNIDRRKLGILSNLSTHEVKINLVIEDNNDDHLVSFDPRSDNCNILLEDIVVKPIISKDLFRDEDEDMNDPNVVNKKKSKKRKIRKENDIVEPSSEEEYMIEKKKVKYDRSYRRIPAIRLDNIISGSRKRSNKYTDIISQLDSHVSDDEEPAPINIPTIMEDADFEPEETTTDSESPYDSYDDDGRRIGKPKDDRIFPMECEQFQCNCEIESRMQHWRHYVDCHPTVEYPYSKSDAKKFVCLFCGKKYRKLSNLNKHEMTHGDKTVKCLKCNRLFSNMDLMRNHMRSVHSEKMWICDYCGKEFKNRQRITLHIRTHTGEKPYKCHICGAGFAHNGNVGIHIRSNHQRENTRQKKKRTTKKGHDKSKKRHVRKKNTEL